MGSLCSRLQAEDEDEAPQPPRAPPRKPNSSCQRLLIATVSSGLSVEVLERVLQNCSAKDVNCRQEDKFGFTPLCWAAHNNLAEHARLLIQHGASVDVTDRAGWTPLIWTACQSACAAAEVLLAAGANPRLRTRTGKSILDYCAARCSRAEAIRLLKLFTMYGVNPYHTMTIGQLSLPSIAWPSVWTSRPETQQLFPIFWRRRVVVLYILHRRADNIFSTVPKPLVEHILAYASPRPFDLTQHKDQFMITR